MSWLNEDFTDRFKEGHYEGWITYGGGWYVNNSALHVASNAGADGYGITGVKAVYTERTFTDFTYSATVTCNESGNAGLIFRVSEPSIGQDAYKGYYLGISSNKKSIVFGKANNNWQELKKRAYEFEPHVAYRIRVEAIGPKFLVFIDDSNAPVLDVEDSSFVSGNIGVRRHTLLPRNSHASFANIHVDPAN